MAKLTKSEMIVRAALDVISENGFHNSPISLIAKRARVPEGSIYRYFKSKDDLIQEIFEYTFREVINATEKGYPSEKSVRERFLHICSAALRYFIKNPKVLRYSDQYHVSPYSRRNRKSSSVFVLNELIENLFIDGIAQKEIKDISVYSLNAITFGILRTIARNDADGEKIDDSVFLKITESCWDAIKLTA